MSCLKDKPNMRAGQRGRDTPEVVGRHLSIIRYQYTVNVKLTLSCTRPTKFAVKRVCVPHLRPAKFESRCSES